MNPSTGKTAQMIIDVQNDFCEGGSLQCQQNQRAITMINELRSIRNWDLIMQSRDWHPKDHVSFFDNYKGEDGALFKEVYLESNKTMQILWPVHCIQNTHGSEFHKDLVIDDQNDSICNKGVNTLVESYSCFGSAGEVTIADQELKKRGITQCVFVGLAYDYCVGQSCLDALGLGYQSCVITEATGFVSDQGSETMKGKLTSKGCEFWSMEHARKALKSD